LERSCVVEAGLDLNFCFSIPHKVSSSKMNEFIKCDVLV
jgi:hypothetical protein